MTNDQIIKTLVSPDHALMYPDFLRAMDAAREDEAVGFKYWFDEYINDPPIGRLADNETLYQLYLKHKNEKK